MDECRLCKRKLKSLGSRELGYGPVCYKKIFGTGIQGSSKGNFSETTDIPYYDIPGQMSLEDFFRQDAEQ